MLFALIRTSDYLFCVLLCFFFPRSSIIIKHISGDISVCWKYRSYIVSLRFYALPHNFSFFSYFSSYVRPSVRSFCFSITQSIIFLFLFVIKFDYSIFVLLCILLQQTEYPEMFTYTARCVCVLLWVLHYLNEWYILFHYRNESIELKPVDRHTLIQMTEWRDVVN